MAITKKEIDEIKSRLEKTSPGPWRVATTTDGEYILDCDDCVVAATFERKEDAYFVAHVREDIPRLMAEIDRLREGLAYLTEDHHFDSLGQMAEVAEYYLNGGDNE